MEIIEGNKLIAEFMYPNAKKEYESGDIIIEDNVFKKVQLIFGHYDQMRYHKSWDWLMPVVEKIEETEKNVFVQNFTIEIKWERNGLGNKHICKILFVRKNRFNAIVHESDSKINAVWLSVVEYIEWYHRDFNKKIEANKYSNVYSFFRENQIGTTYSHGNQKAKFYSLIEDKVFCELSFTGEITYSHAEEIRKMIHRHLMIEQSKKQWEK